MGKIWTKQPPAGIQIDWTNPIASKLAFLWAGPHTGGVYGRDIVSGVFGYSTGAGDVVTTNVGERGHVISQIVDGAAVQNVRFDTPFEIDNTFSVFTLARPTDATLTWHTPITAFDGTGYTTNDITFQQYYFENAADNALFLTRIDSGTNRQARWSSHPYWRPNDQKWWSFGNTATFGVAATRGFFNGQYLTPDSDTLDVATAANVGVIELMSSTIWPDESFGGDLLIAAVFKTGLSDAEHKSLADNPWQVLKPQPRFALADVPTDVRFATVPQPMRQIIQPPSHILFGNRDYVNPSVRGLETNTPLRKFNRFGEYWDFTAASLEYVDWGAGEDFFNATQGTVVSKFRIPTGMTDGFFVSSRASATAGDGGVDLLFTTNVGGAVLLRISDGTVQTGNVEGDIAIVVPKDKWLLLASTYDSATDLLTNRLYDGETGVLIDTNSDSAIAFTSIAGAHSQNLRFANRGSLYFDGDLQFVMTWPVVLTVAEQAAVAANPWQVFKPDEFFVPINESLPDVGVFERSW